jgi:hypothetical protein
MALDNGVRTTCYGRKDNGSKGTALEAFRKSALGMVAFLAFAAGLAPGAGAAEPNQAAALRELARTETVVTEVTVTLPKRVFELHRDRQGGFSVGATVAETKHAGVQHMVQDALRRDGGRGGIEVSVPIRTPEGSIVLQALCLDPAPGSSASCVVFSVKDHFIANESLLKARGASIPSPEAAISRHNLPQNSAAELKLQVEMALNVLDPSLVRPVNEYRRNPTGENWLKMAGAVRDSLMQFIPGRTYERPVLRGATLTTEERSQLRDLTVAISNPRREVGGLVE